VVEVRNPWDPSKFVPILNFTVNACSLIESSKKNPLLKILIQNFKGSTNFESFSCPYEPGKYDILNWEMSDSFLPKYIAKKNEKFVAKIRFLSKKNLKGEIFRFYLYGEIK
jgi:hypothetical protein